MGLGGLFCRPGVKVTKHVLRDINPVWKSTMVLMDVEPTDRILFVVKDMGVISLTRKGEFLPRVIAQAHLGVGQDFQGYLELQPCEEIPDQGSPVLQLSTRHALVKDPNAAKTMPVCFLLSCQVQFGIVVVYFCLSTCYLSMLVACPGFGWIFVFLEFVCRVCFSFGFLAS